MRASIWEKKKIDKSKSKIKDIFAKCYGEGIEDCKFDQLYKKNPFGKPRGVVLKRRNSLIGFYGLVPQNLAKIEGDRRKTRSYLLGVSLMVLPEFRGLNSLRYIMKEAEHHLEETGYSFIMGFPNETSYTPLTRLFDWELLEETEMYIWNNDNNAKCRVDISGNELINLDEMWSVPYDVKEFIKWKELCNSYTYVSLNGDILVVYKMYNGNVDVIDARMRASVSDVECCIDSIIERENANGLIISDYHADNIGLDLTGCKKWSEYKLRLCSMGGGVEPTNLHMSFLMSDVF